MARSRGTWLARMERRLLGVFGPADVKPPDSRRPAPAPRAAPPPTPRPELPAEPEVVQGTVVRDEPPRPPRD